VGGDRRFELTPSAVIFAAAFSMAKTHAVSLSMSKQKKNHAAVCCWMLVVGVECVGWLVGGVCENMLVGVLLDQSLIPKHRCCREIRNN
jgi:hypothetical protein